MPEGGLEKNKDDFSRQFEHATQLIMRGKDGTPTTVNITEILPRQAEGVNPRTLVFSEAFAHALKTYEHTFRELYKNGRHVLTFDHPRSGGEFPDLPADEQALMQEYLDIAPEEVRSARILLAVLDSKGETQADVMTHSRGLTYTALAALLDDTRAKKEGRENRIRNIVAYGPPGLIGDDSLPAIAGRVLAENFARPDWGGPAIPMEQLAQQVADERNEKIERGELPPDTVTDVALVRAELEAQKAAAAERGIIEYGPPDEAQETLAKEAGGRVGVEGAKHVFGSLDHDAQSDSSALGAVRRGVQGAARTLREAVGLSRMKTDALLKKLHDEAGIEIAIAHGESDRVFPTDRMSERLQALRESGILTASFTGVHDTMVQDPRAVYTLEGLFGELEKRRTKRTTAA